MNIQHAVQLLIVSKQVQINTFNVKSDVFAGVRAHHISQERFPTSLSTYHDHGSACYLHIVHKLYIWNRCSMPYAVWTLYGHQVRIIIVSLVFGEQAIKGGVCRVAKSIQQHRWRGTDLLIHLVPCDCEDLSYLLLLRICVKKNNKYRKTRNKKYIRVPFLSSVRTPKVDS